MNAGLRAKIVKAMAERRGESLVVVARGIGISRKTLGDYLTSDLLAEVGELAEILRVPSIENVDKAMLAQACQGNVAAARLVYMRMAQKGQVGVLPTLDELEAELKTLKARETNRIKGLGDGEGISDVAAVADSAAG